MGRPLSFEDELKTEYRLLITAKGQGPQFEAAEKVSIYFINRYRCHTLASVPIFLYNRSREPTINQK